LTWERRELAVTVKLIFTLRHLPSGPAISS